MTRSPVVVLGLVFQACTGSETHALPGNPPMPTPVPAPPPIPATLPAWEEVPSPHPQGATNPPGPVLIVSEEGRCFKRWVSPFMGAEAFQDRVEDCKDACGGTEVQCPPKAAELLATHKQSP